MVPLNTPSISVIVPVHNGGDKFRRCLSSLTATDPGPDEIIVVADGDTDGSWRLAQEIGAQVLRVNSRGGPAAARNLGAHSAKGEIFFFVDADVTVPPDAVGQISAIFQQDPCLSAVFGSYDDQPFETDFLSQYRNLFHHYVHQTSKEDAATFWGACGAIRREVFLKMGGFNVGYRDPAIEDIELGYRLKRAGYRIRLVKALMVTHLKSWNVRTLLKADFFYRALPWTRLILREGRFDNDLNLKITNRISVILANLLLLSFAGTVFLPWLCFVTAGLVGSLLVLNWDLYRFFNTKRGLVFAIKAIPWHWFYYLYSGLAFAIGYAEFRLRLNRKGSMPYADSKKANKVKLKRSD
jgi:GT2 family glycosyltransferase